MQSEQLNELFGALSKAQANYSNPKASKKGVNNNDFSSLEDIWECVRKPLIDQGLTVIQTVEPKEGGTFLVSILGHESGQWIKSYTPLREAGSKFNPMQSMGGAITYARRYALAAIVGFSLANNEDDGESLKIEMASPSQRDKVEQNLDLFPDLRNLIMGELQGNIMNMSLSQYEKFMGFFMKKESAIMQQKAQGNFNSNPNFNHGGL